MLYQSTSLDLEWSGMLYTTCLGFFQCSSLWNPGWQPTYPKLVQVMGMLLMLHQINNWNSQQTKRLAACSPMTIPNISSHYVLYSIYRAVRRRILLFLNKNKRLSHSLIISVLSSALPFTRYPQKHAKNINLSIWYHTRIAPTHFPQRSASLWAVSWGPSVSKLVTSVDCPLAGWPRKPMEIQLSVVLQHVVLPVTHCGHT